jgi:hypothetical protein
MSFISFIICKYFHYSWAYVEGAWRSLCQL